MGIYKVTVEQRVTLTPKAVWAHDWLIKSYAAGSPSEAIANALQLYLAAVRASDDRAVFLSQKVGGKPFPINISAPAMMIEFPPAADMCAPQDIDLLLTRSSAAGFEELKQWKGGRSASEVVEDALCFFYTVVERYLAGHSFLVRFAKTGETATWSPFVESG